jgi:hypothetical protein
MGFLNAIDVKEGAEEEKRCLQPARFPLKEERSAIKKMAFHSTALPLFIISKSSHEGPPINY